MERTMTQREREIRNERLARGFGDPYGDSRIRGASYAEAKAAARAAARVSARQTARDLGALGADLARGTWAGASWVARSVGRGLRGLVGRLRRRRLPESRAARRILAAAEAREKAKDVPFPGPLTLGRLAWIEPPDPTPIETMTIRKPKLGIILEAEARANRILDQAEQAATAREILDRADEVARQPKIKVPPRNSSRY